MKRRLKQSVLVLVCLSILYQYVEAQTSSRQRCARSSSKSHSFICSGSDCEEGLFENADNVACKNACEKALGTLFLPRPQGLNSAVFFDPFLYGCQEEVPCWSWNIGYRYNQTFRDEQIACCLFGSDRLKFAGSKTTSTSNKPELLADNFGLAPDFKGHIRFKPSIKNNIVDFSFRHELRDIAECLYGAYVTINASLVNSIWKLGACEAIETTTPDRFSAFPACYMSAFNTTESVQAAGDLTTALSGDFLFGDMQTKWRFGRFDLNHHRRDTKLANIDFILGYDFLRCPAYHFGGFFKLVAPTGTKPRGHRFFEAIIGNGHHWEVGGGIDAHYELWGCDDHCFTAHLNGAITHLFKNTQWRTFDFLRSSNYPGTLSRYILLKEFTDTGIYANRLINAINFTTHRIKSSFNIQGDAALRIVYRNCGWALGLGYNVYGRSKEKLSEISVKCNEFNRRRFGIKGVNGTCGLDFEESKGLTGGSVLLSSTSSRARAFQNPHLVNQVDNPVKLEEPIVLSWQSPNDPGTPQEDLVTAINSEINDEAAPVFVTKDDIHFRGIPGQLTHKIFAHIDYAWECEESAPYFGIGGGIEFPHNGECSTCTPHQWEIWLRGGLYF